MHSAKLNVWKHNCRDPAFCLAVIVQTGRWTTYKCLTPPWCRLDQTSGWALQQNHSLYSDTCNIPYIVQFFNLSINIPIVLEISDPFRHSHISWTFHLHLKCPQASAFQYCGVLGSQWDWEKCPWAKSTTWREASFWAKSTTWREASFWAKSIT